MSFIIDEINRLRRENEELQDGLDRAEQRIAELQGEKEAQQREFIQTIWCIAYQNGGEVRIREDILERAPSFATLRKFEDKETNEIVYNSI